MVRKIITTYTILTQSEFYCGRFLLQVIVVSFTCNGLELQWSTPDRKTKKQWGSAIVAPSILFFWVYQIFTYVSIDFVTFAVNFQNSTRKYDNISFKSFISLPWEWESRCVRVHWGHRSKAYRLPIFTFKLQSCQYHFHEIYMHDAAALLLASCSAIITGTHHQSHWELYKLEDYELRRCRYWIWKQRPIRVECKMNHDFLAKRVVSDFAAAFRKNPRMYVA